MMNNETLCGICCILISAIGTLSFLTLLADSL